MLEYVSTFAAAGWTHQQLFPLCSYRLRYMFQIFVKSGPIPNIQPFGKILHGHGMLGSLQELDYSLPACHHQKVLNAYVKIYLEDYYFKVRIAASSQRERGEGYVMSQSRLQPKGGHGPSFNERLCSRCMGHRALCGVSPCPLLMRAKALANIESAVRGMNLTGSSPPSVFVGSHGYPKVLAGPLVPPIRSGESAIMERPDLWLTKTLDEILALRFSLIRTKRSIPVDAAVDPPRLLHETQTMALSETPASSEATLIKRPSFTRVFSGRTLPIGPSAPLRSFRLEDNPAVPKAVDKVTSDTDLDATTGVQTLFDEGIHQQQVTRLFSIGMLGAKKRRRLVPTEWSITAVDDIIAKELHKEILRFRWINDYLVFTDYALGNRVTILMMPNSWQFEALECWLSGRTPHVISDHEFAKGRKEYAKDVTGAYYATRLPVLEHLVEMRRQAGVIVFMEIDPRKWVPLGVWRFREIARRGLEMKPQKLSSLDEALMAVGRTLQTSLDSYLDASETYKHFITQSRLTDFF